MKHDEFKSACNKNSFVSMFVIDFESSSLFISTAIITEITTEAKKESKLLKIDIVSVKDPLIVWKEHH